MRLSETRSLWCTTAVLIVIVGLQGYLIVDGLVCGLTVSYSRVGPSITYTRLVQPKLYWFTIVRYTIFEAVFIAMTLGMAWGAREMSKNEHSKKH